MKPSIFLQYIAPKQLITMTAGKLANLACANLTTSVIAWFVKRYQVNMNEALNENIASYRTFNDFFTRQLKADARPIADAAFICPVDGAISQFGNIEQDQIFQAKGHHYSTQALLANNIELASHFTNGKFACLYLSPKDYHRIHMPCNGTLKSMTYVPGDLFSVNPNTAENVPDLFARNERVICEFWSEEHGKFVMVLVGATIVGSMATVWHGIVSPPRSPNIKHWHYGIENATADKPLKLEAITLKKGEEMGRFLLGSTVVMLFKDVNFEFNPDWQPSLGVKLGEVMAND